MTGEKNRFKTHEKLWNIDDKSLKTPKHDAMVLWLMDEENLNKLNIPKKNRVRADKYGWNSITADYKYKFHYLDAIKKFGELDCEEKRFIETEVPLKSSPTFIGGYADLMIFDIIDNHTGNCDIFQSLIEVKPYINSFGAVMRQLNSYKSFGKYEPNMYLFTLDARFDKQFESQGITVLHPPEDVDMDEYAMEMGLI